MLHKYICFLLFAGFCLSCAQQGSPSGGPRDEDPPQVLESDPPNYSTRFEEKKILITFDEYIVLDNVNQELIVSPPMEKNPEVKLRKRTLIIEFEELLKENTTYTFNFGDAIKDLHEGNKLQNFEYVFSTGDVLDSMSIKGTLKYAETLEKPKEPISIMLYSDLRDSVPLTEIPLYVGRSNDSGVFSVNNLRPDEYKIFALKDGNNNFLFDLPSEEIAFLDTSLTVNTDFVRQLLGIEAPDSTGMPVDTLLMHVDTMLILVDSIATASDTIPATGPDLNSIYIDLMLFTEASEIQYIFDYTREDKRKLQMVFALPLTDTFEYDFIQRGSEEIRFLEYFSDRRDSLTLWIIDSAHYKMDSLSVSLKYTVKDTSDQYMAVGDTLVFTYHEKSSKKKKKSDSEPVEMLTVSTIRNGGFQDLHRDLSLNLDFPLEKVTDSLITLYHIPDSVEVPVPFSAEADSILLNRVKLSATWESDAAYKMKIFPGAIASIYPIEHDTIDISFKTRDTEFYGQILLSLENVNHRVLVQLLNKQKVISVMEVDADGQYVFPYLVPREYSFKFIHDLNNNGRWDTGNYLKKVQPEPAELLPATIKVRSNWDHDVTMTLEK
ncbi:MAG: Ig-like domain-containing protein [Bacteroidales bacterium]|nr:Ig-like domain-containing protein [Bacteroidales bacterium]